MDFYRSVFCGVSLASILGAIVLRNHPSSRLALYGTGVAGLIGFGVWVYAMCVRYSMEARLKHKRVPLTTNPQSDHPDTQLGNFKSFLDRKIQEADKLIETVRPDFGLAKNWRSETAKGIQCAIGETQRKEVIGDRFSTSAVLFHESMPETVVQALESYKSNLLRLKENITSDMLLSSFDPRDLPIAGD